MLQACNNPLCAASCVCIDTTLTHILLVCPQCSPYFDIHILPVAQSAVQILPEANCDQCMSENNNLSHHTRSQYSSSPGKWAETIASTHCT